MNTMQRSATADRVTRLAAVAAALLASSNAWAQQADIHFSIAIPGTVFPHSASGPAPLELSRTQHHEVCLVNRPCSTGDVTIDVSVALGAVRSRSQIAIDMPDTAGGMSLIAIPDQTNLFTFGDLSGADVVFIDTADPASTRNVNVFVTVQVAGSVQFGGGNTCGTATRDAEIMCRVQLGAGARTAVHRFDNDVLVQNTMPAGWLPDGLPHPVRLGPFSVRLGTPQLFKVSSGTLSSAVLCGPRADGATSSVDVFADTTMTVGGVVFDGPANIVGHSALLRIQDNIFLGASCPADFNTDGFVNSADFFDFLTALFNFAPAADVNHDGSVNSQDFFDFVAAFFSGC